MTPLTITTQTGTRPGQQIMRLDGPLTLETVPSFLKTVRADSSPTLILDLTHVDIIDSAGVGALIQTHVAFSKAQRKLILTNVNSRNMAVFEITRVAKAFYIYNSVPEAEAAL